MLLPRRISVIIISTLAWIVNCNTYHFWMLGLPQTNCAFICCWYSTWPDKNIYHRTFLKFMEVTVFTCISLKKWIHATNWEDLHSYHQFSNECNQQTFLHENATRSWIIWLLSGTDWRKRIPGKFSVHPSCYPNLAPKWSSMTEK